MLYKYLFYKAYRVYRKLEGDSIPGYSALLLVSAFQMITLIGLFFVVTKSFSIHVHLTTFHIVIPLLIILLFDYIWFYKRIGIQNLFTQVENLPNSKKDSLKNGLAIHVLITIGLIVWAINI